MSRLFFLSIFLLLLFSGCIENPGPDRHLGNEKVRDFELPLNFNHIELARFSFKRIDGRDHLLVSNHSSNPILRFSFSLQMSYSDDGSFGIFMEHPFYECNRFIHILDSKQTLDLGVMENVNMDIGSFAYRAIPLLLPLNLETQGNPLANWYEGKYAFFSKTKPFRTGTMRGMIDAEGSMGFALSIEPGENRENVLMGKVAADSSVDFWSSLPYGSPKNIRFAPVPDGLEVRIRIPVGVSDLDSIIYTIHALPSKTVGQ
jgi:hypothetical protein